MKRFCCLLSAFLLLCGSGFATAHAAGALKEVHCDEQGFSTKIPAALSAAWENGNGLRISVGTPGYVPFVLVWKLGKANPDPKEYFEQYTAHMKEKYGAKLRSTSIMEQYKTGGKNLPAAQYIYDTNGSRLCLVRVLEARGDHAVVYTAKYPNGDGEATLAALDAAVRHYRPDNPQENAEAASKAGGARPLNMTPAQPPVSGTTDYSDGRFTMKLPKGWQIATTGEHMVFAFKAWDPNSPNRTIFLMLKLEPFLKSRAAKEKYRQAAKTAGGGTYAFFAEAPVMTAPTLPAFLNTVPDIKKFCAAFHKQGLTLNPAVVPDMNKVTVVESKRSTIPCPPTCRDNSIARIKFADHRGQAVEGLVTAQPIEGMKYNFFGVDGWFHTVYAFMGVTAPLGEMRELEPILTQCLGSFNFTPSYVNQAINASNAEREALLARGRAMQAAHDAMTEAWRAREAAHDIAFQKWSDGFLGYDRLYDADTGEVYLAELGFYEGYDRHREEYSKSNLRIVDGNSEKYYLQGVDYYITK